MPGTDLGLAEEQCRVMPAAVEQVDDAVGNPRHFGFVLAEALDRRVDVSQQLGTVELEMVSCEGEIVAVLLQDVHEPMRELDITMALAFRLPQRLNEGIVADPVELAGDGFKTDINHDRFLELVTQPWPAAVSSAQRDETGRRVDTLPL